MSADGRSPDIILDRLSRLHPKLIDLGLERTLEMLHAVGDPHLNLPPTIHIAGTNGKGSTLADLKAIYEAAGKRVHAYSSPHLAWFNERIYLAGQNIDDALLMDILEECEEANSGKPITYFEITTAAAFLAFSRVPADVLLLEVGLGGRFDTTNVIEDPAATVITPISIDHVQFLGDTIDKIAFEKAGIIKPGAPVIVAAQQEAAQAVIDARAAEMDAPTYVQDRDWSISTRPDGFSFDGLGQNLDLPKPALRGQHQFGNAAVAVATVLTLQDKIPVSPESISKGIAAAVWPARMQLLKQGPLVDMLPEGWRLWLDGGHNAAAGKVVAELMVEISEDRPAYMILGMLNTKEIISYLDPFKGVVRSLTTIAIPGEDASLSAEASAEAAGQAGLQAAPADDLVSALRDLIASSETGPQDVFICGSLYLAGWVLRENS